MIMMCKLGRTAHATIYPFSFILPAVVKRVHLFIPMEFQFVRNPFRIFPCCNPGLFLQENAPREKNKRDRKREGGRGRGRRRRRRRREGGGLYSFSKIVSQK
jgi:hypothetical protein